MNEESLTINVIGADAKPEVGAKVKFDHTEVSGTTNEQGIVVLGIPKDSYTLDVIVESQLGTVQTPFYVAENGPRKLTVDVVYLQQQLQLQGTVELDSEGHPVINKGPAVLLPQAPNLSGVVIIAGLILVILIAVGGFLVYRYREVIRKRYQKFKRRRRDRNAVPDMSEYFR